MKYQVNIPDGVSGDFKVVSGSKENDTVLYQSIDGQWKNIMDDSDAEAQHAYNFLSAATGDVLLAGLGLGMVLQPLLENNSVTSITIIEKFQEVIDLISSHTPQSDKIRIIKDNIYTWTPDKDFDVAWFDSWIFPFDGPDPVGTYKDTMKTKYQSSVGVGYFWPDGSTW